MSETVDTEFGPLTKDQLLFMAKAAETAERYTGRRHRPIRCSSPKRM